jgi:DNA polymerase III epsilon subunit-like protein
MKLLVFDTETTGLPKNYLTYIPEEWPHVVQFSWLVLDTETFKYTPYDYIIKCPVPISGDATNIHNITLPMTKQQGYDFKDIMSIFVECEKHCDLLIGHNYDFDKGVIIVECMRHNIPHKFEKPWYCTMKMNQYITGKWPKLVWLHQHLFHEEPHNLHNAMVDVLTTIRCYMKIMYGIDLCEKIKGFKKKLGV